MTTKRPRGRPPIVDSTRSNRGLGRMTEEDWALIQAAVAASGVKYSPWAIGVLLREAKKILKKEIK